MNEDYMFEDEDNTSETGSNSSDSSESNERYAYEFDRSYFDIPHSTYTQSAEVRRRPGKGIAIASFVLGVFSMVFFLFGFNLITGLLALILGIFYLLNKGQELRGFAIAGIVTTAISVALFTGSWIHIMGNTKHILTMEQEMLDMFESYYGIDSEQLLYPEEGTDNTF